MSAKLNLDTIKNKNSIQKKALLEAIEKAGNCNRLTLLLKKYRKTIHRGTISKFLKREIKSPYQDLMEQEISFLIQKVTKINGLAERLCPSLKKIKKMLK